MARVTKTITGSMMVLQSTGTNWTDVYNGVSVSVLASASTQAAGIGTVTAGYAECNRAFATFDLNGLFPRHSTVVSASVSFSGTGLTGGNYNVYLHTCEASLLYTAADWAQFYGEISSAAGNDFVSGTVTFPLNAAAVSEVQTLMASTVNNPFDVALRHGGDIATGGTPAFSYVSFAESGCTIEIVYDEYIPPIMVM